MQRIAFLWPIGVGLFAVLVGYLFNIGAVAEADLTRVQAAGMLGVSAAAECLFLDQLLPVTVWRRAMAVAALLLSVPFTVAFLGPVVELRIVSMLIYFACSAIATYVLERYCHDAERR